MLCTTPDSVLQFMSPPPPAENTTPETASLIDLNQEYAVFPNPFTDKIVIKFAKSSCKQYSYTIYTMTGKMIYTENVALTENENTAELKNTSQMQKGMYILQVLDTEKHGKKIFKIIKQ